MEKVEIPRAVREAARRGLELREQFGRGGSAVGEQTARKLCEDYALPLEEVRRIAQNFSRHTGDLDQDGSDGGPPSSGYIDWMLWGGDAGREWSLGALERRGGDER